MQYSPHSADKTCPRSATSSVLEPSPRDRAKAASAPMTLGHEFEREMLRERVKAGMEWMSVREDLIIG